MKIRIALIIDESGSMASMQVEAKNSVVNYIKEQQKVEGECVVTIVKFSDYYKVVVRDTAIRMVNADEFAYHPSNTTALYDAVGRTINNFEANPIGAEKTIFVIITDGMENASREFHFAAINAAIAAAQARGWVFLYLAQGLQAAQQGVSMGIWASNVATAALGAVGASASYSSASSMSKKLRTGEVKTGATGQLLNTNMSEEYKKAEDGGVSAPDSNS